MARDEDDLDASPLTENVYSNDRCIRGIERAVVETKMRHDILPSAHLPYVICNVCPFWEHGAPL